MAPVYHHAFAAHLLVELPASFMFFAFPSAQLAMRQPHAHPIIRQYAVLLMSMNAVAGVFIRRPVDGTSSAVASAMALYHLAPLTRASSRMWAGIKPARESAGEKGQRTRSDGGVRGSALHFAAHAVCFVLLVLLFLKG